LARARAQLHELRGIERSYLAEKPVTVSLTYDTRRHDYVHTAIVTQPPPRKTSPLVGELAHTLRAALDNMVTSAAVANVGLPLPKHERPAMPVCLDESRWDAARRSRLIDLSLEAQAAIRSLQPFMLLEKVDKQWHEKPDRHPLYLLDELWNRDKHHAPRVAVVTLRRGRFNFNQEAELKYIYWAGVARRKVIGRHTSTSGQPLKDRSRFRFQFGFAQWPFRNGDPLVAHMASMVEFVWAEASALHASAAVADRGRDHLSRAGPRAYRPAIGWGLFDSHADSHPNRYR
jgi:hypothetical protein